MAELNEVGEVYLSLFHIGEEFVVHPIPITGPEGGTAVIPIGITEFIFVSHKEDIGDVTELVGEVDSGDDVDDFHCVLLFGFVILYCK